jgi:hypothetical protein
MLGSMRLFGKNIQDSSLVIKAGKYYASQEFLKDFDPSLKGHSGDVYGADLQLYLFQWMGAEADILKYQGAMTGLSSAKVNGEHKEYRAFVEISLLRFVVGQYRDDWKISGGDVKADWSDTGYIAGLKIQL